jgi:hypothetical protein
MTYIIMTIAGVWAVATVTFFAALGLAAKRPMPAPDSMEEHGASAELQYASSTPASEQWQPHAEPHGLEGALAHSAA